MKPLLLLLLLGLPAALGAPQSLSNTHWELLSVRVDGRSSLAPAGTSRPTLSFQKDGTVTGYGGCNQYRGQYTAQQKRLKVEGLVSTKVACRNLETETRFFGVLGSATTVVYTPYTMAIWTSSGDSILLTRTQM